MIYNQKGGDCVLRIKLRVILVLKQRVNLVGLLLILDIFEIGH